VEGETLYYVSDISEGFGSVVKALSLKTGITSEIMKSDYLIMELARFKNIFLITYKDKGGSQEIALLDPSDGSKKIIAATPWQEYAATAEGGRIFFTSNRGGVLRAYCADADLSTTYMLTEKGYSDGAVYEENSGFIFYTGISAAGYDIYSKKPEFTLIEPARTYEPGHEPVSYDEDVAVEKGSYFDNLASLYPKLRLPAVFSLDDGSILAGLVLGGQDAIGDFTYQTGVYYDTTNGGVKFDASVNSYIFSPLAVYASGDNYSANGGWLGIELPLLWSPQMGLNYISIGVSGRGAVREPYYSRFWGWAPYINFGMSFDRTFWGLSLRQMNKYYYSSDYQDTRHFLSGASGTLFFKQYFGNVKAEVSCSYIEDNGSEAALPKAAAYSEQILSDRGWHSAASVSAKLFEVRGGLWNPLNIYIEDVFAKVFGESVSFESQRQLSAGIELTAEVKTFFMADMELGASAAFALDGGFKTMFILRSPLVNFTAKKGAEIWGCSNDKSF
jgi:hypothetical protein